jgi:hypothetical protein
MIELILSNEPLDEEASEWLELYVEKELVSFAYRLRYSTGEVPEWMVATLYPYLSERFTNADCYEADPQAREAVNEHIDWRIQQAIETFHELAEGDVDFPRR